jgi:serine/threonine protein kinase
MKEILSTRVRFGAFELDLKAGELRKGSRALLLQEQPLRVLQMIVERGGELATRQEIQKKLWPNDTVVDFDHGINTAIKKIRQALGDSADNPRYIQTVARRGYRLLVPIEWVDAGTDGQSDQKEIDGRSVKATPSAGDLTGKKVSHYRVLEVLGGGGMGVVYKAEDLKLGRAVAMKFLPEEVGDDPRAKERFEREARAASALDHPNICSIYEFGEYVGRPFIVMQFLAGQNLRDLLADSRNDRGYPFRVDELLDLAIQITAGLGAAHEKGIIHRDIKPANIFITNRREAKVLDFGVAKILGVGETVESADANSSASSGPNGETTTALLTVHLTRTGAAPGTEGYMSPEQIRAERLDTRSDLFSFGLVLYEMATGQRAFSGDTAAEVHEAILHQAPVAPRELNPEIPPELEAIIRRCLEKERERRYQTAEELMGVLEGLPDAPPNGGTNQPARGDREPAHVSVESAVAAIQAKPRSLWPMWLLAAAVLVVGLVPVIRYLRRPLPPPRISSYTQITHDGHEKEPRGTDGSRLYVIQWSPISIGHVWITGGEIVHIPVPVPLLRDFDDISPDGSNLLVESLNEGSRDAHGLWNFRIPGGPLRRLGEDFDAAFSPDGKSVIYSTPGGDIYLVRSDGSGTHKLASVGAEPASFSWSVDGGIIRFNQGGKLWQMSSDGSNLHQLVPGGGGRWTPDGRFFVFLSEISRSEGSQIWALDEGRGLFRRPPAEPIQLTTGPLTWSKPIPGKDGKSIFAEGIIRRGELSRFDAKSKQVQRFLGGISADDANFSKDGQFVAYVSFPEGILWKANRDGMYGPAFAAIPDDTDVLVTHAAPYAVLDERGGDQELRAVVDIRNGRRRLLR